MLTDKEPKEKTNRGRGEEAKGRDLRSSKRRLQPGQREWVKEKDERCHGTARTELSGRTGGPGRSPATHRDPGLQRDGETEAAQEGPARLHPLRAAGQGRAAAHRFPGGGGAVPASRAAPLPARRFFRSAAARGSALTSLPGRGRAGRERRAEV